MRNRKEDWYILMLGIGILVNACLGINEPDIKPSETEELIILRDYLDAIVQGGHDLDTTDLGVYYVTLEEGEGAFPQTGDTLEVGFAGYFVDGTLFDASDFYEEGGTFEFVLGNPPMIKGWDNGMTVINKNAEVQLIIPSKLAFGGEGAGNIPPYKTLVFVVKMKEIKHINIDD